MNEEKANTTIIEVKIPTPNDFQVKDAVDRALLNLKQINELILQNNSEIYIRELLNRVEQLQNNWNELKKWLEEEYEYYDKHGTSVHGYAMGQINRIKSKMQELEKEV